MTYALYFPLLFLPCSPEQEVASAVSTVLFAALVAGVASPWAKEDAVVPLLASNNAKSTLEQ